MSASMLQQQKSSNLVNLKDTPSSSLRIIKQRGVIQKQALNVLNDKEEIGGSSTVSRNDLAVTMKSPQPPTLPRQDSRSPKKLQDSLSDALDTDSYLLSSSARPSSAMTAVAVPSSSQCRHIHAIARESYDYNTPLPDVNPQKASLPLDFIPTDVGLENLGNTCFMNSTLQCLLHIEPLVRYFLHNDIDKQLNLASPKKGHLASSFRQLVDEVYRRRVGTTTAAAVVVVSPSHLQRAVSTYAPYLMDYQQQDSQEFLRFLLDGISEDLCRKHSQDDHSNDSSSNCNPKSAPESGALSGAGRSRSSTIAVSLSILPALVPPSISPSPSTPSSSSSPSPGLLLLSPQNLAGAKPVLISRFVDGLSDDDDNSVTAQCSASAGNSPVLSTPNSSSSSSNSTTHASTSSSVTKLREETRHSRRAVDIEWSSTKRSSNQSYDEDGLSGSIGSPLDSSSSSSNNINNNINKTSAVVYKYRNRWGPFKGSQKSDSDSEGGGSNEESSARSAARMNSSSNSNSSGYRSSTAGTRNAYEQVVPTQQPSDSTADLSVAAEKEARQAWDKYLQLNDSIITDLFAGQLQSTIKCLTCNHRSSSYDPFLDLSVPIHKGESEPPKSLLGSFKSSLGSGETNKSTLEKCLGIFTAEEVLDGDNMYMCEKCKKKQRSVKQLTVYKYPRVLVIHIKRFRFNSMRREKLSTDVHFPLSGLDLSPFISPDVKLTSTGVPGKDWRRSMDNRSQQHASPPPVYDLIAVSNHHGSLHSGHYIAHVDITGGRVDQTPRWMCFNDARVSIASASSISGPTAYVLFYKLKEQQLQPSSLS